jgi:hypothetical protein
MSDTASVRIYRIRDGMDLNAVTDAVEKLQYIEVGLDKNIQQVNGIEIHAFIKSNRNRPEWADMLWAYIGEHDLINRILKLDFIGLIKCKSKSERDVILSFFGGSGYFDVESLIDKTFGITILESVFDPSSNRIKSVADKGIIGDILASRRFYRFARPVSYEEDFGRYYQDIEVRLSNSQLLKHFPLFTLRKGAKLKPNITVSGSATLDVRIKLNMVDFICLAKDLTEQANIESPHIFNRSLIPLSAKSDKELITRLDENLLDDLASCCLGTEARPIDFDFCHRDFETFFSSSSCRISLDGLTSKKGMAIEPIEVEDVYDLTDLFITRQLAERIRRSREYEKAPDRRVFMKDTLRSAQVVTNNDEGMVTTKGKFKEYLQQELEHEGVVYFLLDNRWYHLQNTFESTLKEKYIRNIKNRFQKYDFIQVWKGPDEEAYNKQYFGQANSFFLHRIKIDHVELADVIVVDEVKGTIYFLHVKDGIGAAIRDLTSQVHMAARIIEEEVAAGKDKIKRLYQQAVVNQRIDPKTLTEESFLGWIENSQRIYVLGVHDSTKTRQDVIEGNLNSRIAKYSLIGFAQEMRASNWEFSLCFIE